MTTPVAVEYRDRSAGLMIYGVLEIIAGALSLLLVPLTAISMLIVSRQGNVNSARVAMLPPIVGYGLAAVVFVWLGVGSILARRWARTLWVCVSALVFWVGLLAVPIMVYVTAHHGEASGRGGRPPMPPVARIFAAVLTDGFLLLAFFVIPAAIYLFYRRQDVQRTCEVKDPVVRWTDRCPTPVLSLSLFLALGAVSFLPVPNLRGKPAFMGTLVTGWPAPLITALTAGMWLYIAWGLYQMRRTVWWLALAATLTVILCRVTAVGIAAMAPSYPVAAAPGQVGAAASILKSSFFRWYQLVWLIPWLGWLLYAHRYFAKAPPAPAFSAPP